MGLLINISTDFSKAPGARYRVDGRNSGQEFYEDCLYQKFTEAIEKDEQLTINLDGTFGFATSFLSEAFSRLSNDFGKQTVLKRLILISLEEPYLKDEIHEYISDSQ